MISLGYHANTLSRLRSLAFTVIVFQLLEDESGYFDDSSSDPTKEVKFYTYVKPFPDDTGIRYRMEAENRGFDSPDVNKKVRKAAWLYLERYSREDAGTEEKGCIRYTVPCAVKNGL